MRPPSATPAPSISFSVAPTLAWRFTHLETAGFVHRRSAGVEMFLDGPGAKARDAVHILFSGEKVRPHYPYPAPDVDAETTGGMRLVSLDALVRMKLTSFRDRDRTHLRDMIDVGLVDATWCQRLPTDLGKRLQVLIDDPNG